MNHLVIGKGQIGSAIQKVLKCDGIDYGEEKQKTYDIIDICFGYSENFIDTVKAYQKKYQPKYTVIHSTVPIGTSDQLGAVHSPVRGRHPDLYKSMFVFTKYFGGIQAKDLKEEYQKYGFSVSTTPNARNTEALKLWDTTQYGWNIVLQKHIAKFCKEYNLDFNLIYTRANRSYNSGYSKLKGTMYRRPTLKHQDGKIGGHCVIPNAQILRDVFNDKLAAYILTENESYE